MSTLQKLKAYFGMIPADEVDGYADEYDDYHGDEYVEDDYVEPPAPRRARPAVTSEVASASRPRPWVGQTAAASSSRAPVAAAASAMASRSMTTAAPTMASRSAAPSTAVRGALAVDTQPAVDRQPTPLPEPVTSAVPITDNALGKITTLHLRSYQEARSIGEQYRDGNPVIMDLTEMADADAKRLVDFAAGLAFAMRGSMDKITSKVFLISPPNVDVTAEDRRRLAEGGFLRR